MKPELREASGSCLCRFPGTTRGQCLESRGRLTKTTYMTTYLRRHDVFLAHTLRRPRA